MGTCRGPGGRGPSFQASPRAGAGAGAGAGAWAGGRCAPRVAWARGGHRAPTTPALGTRGSQGGEPARLAVFVSGGGSNLRALQEAVERGRVAGEVAAVLSDKHECGGVAFARQRGIPTHIYPAADEDGLSPEGLVELLQGHLRVDFVVLAGYLKLIPPELCRAYPRGILNIHPALLPAFGGKGFYGKRVHRAVVESGARFSGATVHFVDEEYDRGPILAQRAVEVRPHDTADDLAARVLQEEHRVLPEAVAALCSGRVEWRQDGIPFIWKAS